METPRWHAAVAVWVGSMAIAFEMLGTTVILPPLVEDFGITTARLRGAKPDAIVMHPGPMNRGVEITDEVADGPQSVILRQVANGVKVRMAVLERALG